MTYIITTPLYYVNDKPHLGSVYTTLICDSIARYKRLMGNEVIFITGVMNMVLRYREQHLRKEFIQFNIVMRFHQYFIGIGNNGI